jgi:hypothetical protein
MSKETATAGSVDAAVRARHDPNQEAAQFLAGVRHLDDTGIPCDARATGEVALAEQCAGCVLSEYESLDHEGSRLS